MNNLNAQVLFTESLNELIEDKFTVFQSLRILAESKLNNQKIKNAADFMANEIEKGSTFASVFQKCPYITFDKVYVSFISFSEETGRLSQTMKFLSERCRRKKELLNSFTGALVYPAFIFLIVSFLILFIAIFGNTFFGINSISVFDKGEMLGNFFWSFLTFIFLSLAVFWGLWTISSDSRLYEAFLAGGFLVENGVNVSAAVGMAAEIQGIETKNGRAFIKAKEGLEYGMGIHSAFCSHADAAFKNKVEAALLLAEETGNKNEVLSKIALNLKKENDRKRKLCLTLVEPAFVFVTGIFLIQMVVGFVYPLFAGFGLSI